jgi:ATP-dependent DNA helicase PIF1
MNLNQGQQSVLNDIIAGKNVYIGGAGGVGKSYLLRHLVKQFVSSSVLIAPTGIAALNIGGATAHRTFRLPIHIHTKKDHQPNQKAEELFSKDGPVKRLIMDEVSMFRSDVFTTMDQQLRKIRRINKPFGGLQVIVVGDFFQLSPVVSNQERDTFYQEYDSEFCFDTSSWAEADFQYRELTEIMRQSDVEMISHLNNIRKKTKDYQDSVLFFNDIGIRNQVSVLDTDPVFLCATNASAHAVNMNNYDELDGREHVFYAKKEGDFRDEPSPREIRLKHGTKLICCANTGDLFNGQVCYFLDMIDGKMRVLVESTEREVLVDRYTWNAIDYTRSADGSLATVPIGSYTQFPFKYGWGITVHKSQGMTLENAAIDPGNGFFAHGQAYVALSRLKSLEGLALMKELRFNDIIVDKRVVDFYAGGCKGIGIF